MSQIACPRCMPPGDPCCPYCEGTFGVDALGEKRLWQSQPSAEWDVNQQPSKPIPYRDEWPTLKKALEESNRNLREANRRLSLALIMGIDEATYWLTHYRSHSGAMNATHLGEKEGLERRIKEMAKVLACFGEHYEKDGL